MIQAVPFVIALALTAVPPPLAAASCQPSREAATLQLGDFASPAEFESPPPGTAVRGGVVLFAGSDVADKDGAIEGAGGRIVSRPLRQIADALACAGYVSLRYNKRYVTGPTTVDRARFATLDGSDLAADGRAAVAALRDDPRFSHVPLALVGWSEGSTVAMAVASAEPDVRAVVLLSPIVEPMARTVGRQYARIGKPYLQRYATAGALDAAAVARAADGPGGDLAQIFVRQFRGFRPGERINPLLDTDKDGRISFAEADPVIAGWYADRPDGGLGIAATGRALPGVADAYAARTPPLLLLQGLNDSMVDAAPAQRFAAASGRAGRVTLLTYPGLGHSLGAAPSAQEDRLLPVAAAPLRDMIGWLNRRLPQRPSGVRR